MDLTTNDATGTLLSDLDDAELERLLAEAAPGLRAAPERCSSPEALTAPGPWNPHHPAR